MASSQRGLGLCPWLGTIPTNPNGNWVHAYLHRVEGDNDNAAYWYHRASKPICTSWLADEWEEIVIYAVIKAVFCLKLLVNIGDYEQC